MREIVFDTETTGLDPNLGHKLVELGCVEIVNKIRTGRDFHVYINPERDVPIAATNVHGLTTEFLADKPIFKEVADDFLEFIADSPLVIHNAAFDMKFINYELKLIDKPLIYPGRAIDTLDMARKKFPGAKANLDALCNRFGIDLSSRTKHGALLDAELLADVYLELIGGRQIYLSLGEEKEGDTPQGGSVNVLTDASGKEIRKIREFLPSDEEIKAHEAFLESMKHPLWKQA